MAVDLTATASYTDGQATMKMMGKASANPVRLDSRNKPPVFGDEDPDTEGVQNATATRKVEENTKALAGMDDDDAADNSPADNVDKVVMATDTRADADAETLTYSLGGADAAKFRVRDNGQIEVASGTELDYETKDTYMVTVMAEDPLGVSASIEVTIMVTDLDEMPDIMRAPDANVAPEFASATTSRTVAENTAAGEDIGTPVAATDNNGDTLAYTLGGTDAASFAIDSDTGQLMTKAALDYETKSTYSVTVTASDSGGLSDSIDVTNTVTNVDEDGEVTLSAAQPVVDTELTATLADPDGGVTGETWQWAQDDGQGGYTDISGATSATYTPVSGDDGKRLQVTASYGDAEGANKTASAMTEATTSTAPPDEGGYDANNDGQIDKSELITAINDYLFEETITKAELIEVINEYLF